MKHKLDKGGYIVVKKFKGSQTKCHITGKTLEKNDIGISFSQPNRHSNEWISFDGLEVLKEETLKRLNKNKYEKFMKSGYSHSVALKKTVLDEVYKVNFCCYCGEKHYNIEDSNLEITYLRISSGQKSSLYKEVCIFEDCIKEFFDNYEDNLPDNFSSEVLISKL